MGCVWESEDYKNQGLRNTTLTKKCFSQFLFKNQAFLTL